MGGRKESEIRETKESAEHQRKYLEISKVE
jgi:hypothetical protein